MYNNIYEAITALRKGRPIIIVDDDERENEGDLVVAAQTVTDGSINFMVKHSSGVICLSTTEQQLEKMGLVNTQSTKHAKDKFQTGFCASFEASKGISTGISAKDRAYSIRLAANPNIKPDDIISPGHVLTLKANDNGLKARQGHTEASVAICSLAGLFPAAAIVELPNENGDMMRQNELNSFAQTYDIPMISIADIIEAEKKTSQELITFAAQSNLPTEYGQFTIKVYHEEASDKNHIVLVKGDVSDKEHVPVRLHSQCLTGDVFHSTKCDCRSQLHYALEKIQNSDVGMLIWLRQEGRNIGLINKIKAYSLQDEGMDTVEANQALGLPVDARDWDIAVKILNEHKPKSIDLITNNPNKFQAVIDKFTGDVNIVKAKGEVTETNQDYLRIKKEKMGHLI